jgi:hypothetical protein
MEGLGEFGIRGRKEKAAKEINTKRVTVFPLVPGAFGHPPRFEKRWREWMAIKS